MDEEEAAEIIDTLVSRYTAKVILADAVANRIQPISTSLQESYNFANRRYWDARMAMVARLCGK